MVDPLDRVAQNDGKGPEVEDVLPNGETLIGLHIRGVAGHVILGIRLDRHSRPESCAVTNAFGVETGWSAQSNPRRYAADDE